ncbi:MAG: hypothetical protein ASARMPRED_000099 [Alectoria sarmentosa]|nr:MAG: hypothetical protein ASARMPRED_000099 [Alectoria sarmentosa]
MSSTDPVPSGVDIYESQQPQLYAALIITYILRLSQGFGRHYEVLRGDSETEFFKLDFAAWILYALVICLVKFSILTFYQRLFAASIRLPCYILGIITTCWGVATIAVIIAHCNPVSGYWNRKIAANCVVNETPFFVGVAIPNILTDVALLLLPMPYVWQLHTTSSQKMALTGIFMLGSLVSIISIVRLTTLVHVDLKSPDLDYNFAHGGIWTTIESNIAIVAACLPSLRPVLCLIIYKDPNPSAWGPKNHDSGRGLKLSHPSARIESHGGSPGESNSHHKFIALSDETHGLSGAGQSPARLPLRKEDIPCREDIEMLPLGRPAVGEINVRSDVDVIWAQSY